MDDPKRKCALNVLTPFAFVFPTRVQPSRCQRTKKLGKHIARVCSRWQGESIGVSYVAIGSVPQQEFDQQVKKDALFSV